MEGGKKIVAIVILLVGIVAVVRYTIKRGKPPPMPAHVKNVEKAKIDSKTNKVIVQTQGEWWKDEPKDGKYKNPETGEYTMVDPMPCYSCAEQIPVPEMPTDVADLGAQGMDEIIAGYMCPLCSDPASQPRE